MNFCIFDRLGRLTSRAGGHGGGPGEFVGPVGLTNIWLAVGDTVAVWEHGRSRLSLFDRAGHYIGGTQVIPSAGAFPMAVGVLTGQQIVALHRRDRRPRYAGELYRDSLRFVVYSANGTEWSVLGYLPGYERFGYEFQGSLRMGRLPFAREPVAVAHGRHFYCASGDAYEIRIYSGKQLSLIIRRQESDRRLSPEDIATDVSLRMAAAPKDPAVRQAWQRSFDEVPYPSQVPAINRILVDDVGRLWVRAYSHPQDTVAKWSIFDLDGRWVQDAWLPIELHVLDVGTADIIAVWKDEFDVERVGVFKIEPMMRQS